MDPAKLDTNEEHPSEAGMVVHPMVRLLVARMESHPHEFYRYVPGKGTMPNNNKVNVTCGQSIEHTKSLWNRKEKRLYNMALREVRLEEAHHRLMAVLLEDK